jgi:hypothetical protein
MGWREGKHGQTEHKYAVCRKCGDRIEIKAIRHGKSIDFQEWIKQAKWQVDRINVDGVCCPDCQKSELEKFPTKLALMPIRSELERQKEWFKEQIEMMKRSLNLYEKYLSEIQ